MVKQYVLKNTTNNEVTQTNKEQQSTNTDNQNFKSYIGTWYNNDTRKRDYNKSIFAGQVYVEKGTYTHPTKK